MKKQSNILRGKIIWTGLKKGANGITVFFSNSSDFQLKTQPKNINCISNQDGEFTLFLPKGTKQDGWIFLLDNAGENIAAPLKYSTAKSDPIEIQLDPDLLTKASLPRQIHEVSFLQAAIFETINHALNKLEGFADPITNQAIVERLQVIVPPIEQHQELLQIAQGVIEGNTANIRRLRLLLENFELWNQKNGDNQGIQLTAKQSNELLSDEYLSNLLKNAAFDHTEAQQIAPTQKALLRTAAMRAAGENATRIHRYLHIVDVQLLALERIGSLKSLASRSLTGDKLAGKTLVQTIGLFLNTDLNPFNKLPERFPENFNPGGAAWTPDLEFFPTGGLNFPLPGLPPIGGGNPIPGFPPIGGGGSPWPPFPGGDEDGPWYPPALDPCEVELIRALGQLFAHGVMYTISSISPETACPGDEIIIRGNNFEFEGLTGQVVFEGPEHTRIMAVPHFYSPEEIRVIVPEHAVCGDIELRIPGAAVIYACEIRIELFSGPAEPFRFKGGRPHISLFTLPDGDRCFRNGEARQFLWNVCNASGIRLDISALDGSLASSFDFTPGRDGTGSFTFTAPDLPVNTRMRAVLTASGVCGVSSETIFFSIRQGTFVLPPGGLDSIINQPFRNWHRNIQRTIQTAAPGNLSDLVSTVKLAEAFARRVGVMGSAWSYSDCVIPDGTSILIDMNNLGRAERLRPPGSASPNLLMPGLADALASDSTSILNNTLLTALNSNTLPLVNRLVLVEAGIKIFRLNCFLDAENLALLTMGGDKGQSISGAINTSTHGANPQLPPIADCVRAIHLLGPGAVQWWIEPSSNPITDREAMNNLKNTLGATDPCLLIVYDDDLFRACLVSGGSAGIVYAYVIETVRAHNLETTITGMHWESAKAAVRNHILDPITPDVWFLEVIVNPTRQARVTTRQITRAMPPTPPPPTPGGSSGVHPLVVAMYGFLFGPAAIPTAAGAIPAIIGFGTGAVATVLGAYPAYIIRRTAEILSRSPFPWEWPNLIRELHEEIEFIDRSVRALESLIRTLASGAREEDVAALIPQILNIVWQMGFYVISGRDIVETAQNIFTNTEQRPEGITIRKSYVAMTDQTDCTRSTAPPEDHPALFRLIMSHEYALPANECLEFADEILGIADGVRTSNDALIVSINIRITRPTRAFIGIQQFPKTGHLEIYTVRGMAGNDEFHRRLNEAAVRRNAIPHHGQFPDDSLDYQALFDRLGLSRNLDRWRRALDRIAMAGAPTPNTFRRSFFRRRNLLGNI